MPRDGAPPPQNTRTTCTQGHGKSKSYARAHICRRKQQKVWMYTTRAIADGDTCNANAPSNQRDRHPFSFPEYAHPIGRHRRRKCGHRQRTHEEQEATNTAERNKDGHQRGRKPPTPEKMWTPPKNTRRKRSHQHRGTDHEWYEGIPNGRKRWYEGRPTPRNRGMGATRHQRGHHRQQTHKPQARGHKKSKWYAHTRKHARARYGEGARALTRRREHHGDRRTQDGKRERRKQRRHASTPADQETAKKPTLLRPSVGHQRGRKHNTTSRPAHTPWSFR